MVVTKVTLPSLDIDSTSKLSCDVSWFWDLSTYRLSKRVIFYILCSMPVKVGEVLFLSCSFMSFSLKNSSSAGNRLRQGEAISESFL
mgnify:CR=1 FL=1